MKNYIIGLLASAWAIIAPTVPILICVGTLIAFDFLTAIIAANKNKQPITSKKARKSIPKIIAYNVAIASSCIIEYLMNLDIPVVKLVACAIAFIEIKSIDENIKKMIGVNLLGFVKKIFKSKESDIFDLSNQIGSTGEKNKDKVSEK